MDSYSFVKSYVHTQCVGSHCIECNKEFTFFTRKVCQHDKHTYLLSLINHIPCSPVQYQCHRCSDEVCDSCSKHKLPIPDLSSKPKRVCDTCFDILSVRYRGQNNLKSHRFPDSLYIAIFNSPMEHMLFFFQWSTCRQYSMI